MLRNLNVILILGLCLLNYPVKTKEIPKGTEYLSSSIEEIAEEMNNLNSSLDLLSITISNLVHGNNF